MLVYLCHGQVSVMLTIMVKSGGIITDHHVDMLTKSLLCSWLS
jgi:hypothetical protein